MSAALAIAGKDLRSELRALEIAPAMAIFALTLVFILSFAIPPGAGRAPVPAPEAGAVGAREISAVFLWVSLLFASVLGFGRSAALEREGGHLDSIVLSPADPAAVFFGKLMANAAFLGITQLVMVPFFALLINAPKGSLFPGIIPVLIVADIGMAAAGTLLGVASQHARARSLVLPLLLFPLLIPLVLGASRLTGSLMVSSRFAGEGRWFILMTVYDVVFVAIGAALFEFVIRE